MHRLKLLAAALALAAALGGTTRAVAGEGRIQVAPSRQSPLGGQNVADAHRHGLA
jgi:hypothetical protein